MSAKEKFERAVEIVSGLPKDGPGKPTQDQQLVVSSIYSVLPRGQRSFDMTSLASSTSTINRVRFLPIVHLREG